ncbi:major facilitator superfamily transporter protein [Rutstroemia sp. NJR-2017a WRK4]|nr:major facilitator superfamily transporter protein [Rutstroemia sp. NJR-2017a WRK4]
MATISSTREPAHAGTSSRPSSRDTDSAQSYSETDSLLSPNTAASTPNYKTTKFSSDLEARPHRSDEASEDIPVERVTKGAALIISLLLIGVFISYADGTLVIATYGTIASEFGALGDASWLATSYTLATCAVQPLTGKLSDIYGRKSVLLISYALFAAGCVLTGLSGAMWQTILGRVVAGVGSAGMSVMVSMLIIDLVPLIQVAAWRSYVNVVGTIGRGIGGPLGGLLADTIGWRWSFIGQGPVMLVAIILVAAKLPAHSTSDVVQSESGHSRLRRIDFFGAFLLAGTVTSFLGALSLGGQTFPWSHPIVIGLLIGSILLSISFVFYENKYAAEPIFPPALLIRREVAAPYAILALQTGAQVGMMYSVPIYFRVAQESSNTLAGLHLFPAVIGNTLGGLLAGLLIQKTGRYKTLLTLSALSSVLSYTLLILTWHTGPLSFVSSLFIFPGGFGLGITAACTFIALTASIQKKELSIATGGMYLAGSIGMVVGVALCAGVLNNCLGATLAGSGLERSVIRKAMEDVGSIKYLQGDVKKAVVGAYVKSLEASHVVTLSFSLLAFVVSLLVREKKIK